MNRKEILTIILLICVIFSLQAVSAADSGSDSIDSDVLSVDNVSSYALPSSNIDTLAEVANADSFNQLAGNLSGASEVSLIKNYTYKDGDSFSNGIAIDHDIVIDGQGKVTIDANNQARIFKIVNGATVTLKGITFINGNTASATDVVKNGGSILVANGMVNIIDCTFKDNTAYYGMGGAVCLSGSGGNITNSYFEGNRAINNPGTENTGGAGAVFINANNTNISHSEFINNWAGLNGGAVGSSGNHVENCTITNCTFTSNIANGSAGGVGMQSRNFHIYNSTFKHNEARGNYATNPTYPGNGGGMVMRGWDSYAYNCTFINNTAAMHGGAAYLTNTTYNPLNNNTGFVLCIFTNNTAGYNGGAVDWHAGATHGYIEDCTFTNNTAKRSGGAVHWSGHYGSISNSTFTGNNATGEVTSTIAGITGGGDGGAVLWAGINGTVENCWFTNNTAARNGGAVYLENCSHGNWNTTFSHSHFINNTAGYNGGAIYYREGAHDGKISYSEFINNTAKRNGGAIFWNGYNGTVKNSRFENNRATGTNWEHTMDLNMGDTIVVNNDGSLTLGNIIVIQSDKLPTPTDISIYKDNLVVLNSTSSTTTYYSEYYIIVENSTGGKEWKKISESEAALNYTLTLPQGNITNVTELPDISSIATSALNNLYILNISVSTSIAHFESWVVIGNDTAGYEWKQLDEFNITVSESIISPVDWAIDQYYGGDGGTILWSGDVGLVENCTFIDSNSARRGGGAYMTGCDNVTYESCNFTNCTSGTNGGGVDWLAGANYGKIYNCTFNNTRAARSAGAIYYDGWYGDMQNITIVNTQSWGGALKQSKDKLVNYAGWDSSHWDTNTTGGDAGAIMFTGSFINVYNVTFTNCNASGRGGAVFLQDNHNVTFNLCTFENNIASGTAHNTYNNDKDISSGLNTWLTGYGGAIAFDVGATNGTIKNSKFTNNTAIRLGGAISFGKGSANAHVWNSTFDNNTAYRNGGAISWDGTNGKMEDCNFTNNSALGTDINRGIFDLTSLSQIKNVTSISEINSEDYIYILVTKDPTTNKATLYEMYVYKNNTAIKLEETTETGPSPTDWTVDEYFGGDGGTIYWRGDKGIVDNCRFIGSNSARRGGGAYMAGSDNITFQNSYFFNCTSGTNGGGLDWLAGANYGKVINCTFEETCAVRSAGAIYYDGDYGEFRDIVVKNTHTHGGELESKNDLVNYAGWDASHWDTNTTGGDGGAIMLTGDHIYIYNATFINCTASGRGGAVFLQDNNNVTLELCTFENNRALGIANNTYNDARDTSSGLNKWFTGNGGAIAFDKGASNGTIISSKFINNTAARNGGAVSFSVNSTNAYIFNSSFTNNTAKRNGGALDWDGTNGNISYCNFTQNHALGTAISTEYANITSLNDVIAKNGDTVSALGKPSIATDNKLYVLVVSEGGKKVRYELYVSQVADLHYWLKIDETTETSASPVDWAIDEYFGGDGGSIYWSGDNATIDHCNFLDSNSARRGGGAYMTGGDHVSYVNCTFENCTSGTNGGGLDWFAGANYGKVVDCNFTNTQAARSAGAIYYDGDYGEFINIIIRNATAHGGDLYECKDGKVKYAGWDSSHWDTNTTGGDAGAIMLTGDHIKLYNVNVTDCTAVGRGGAVFVQDNHNVTFELCRFENNRALGTANNTFNDPYDTSSGINHNLTGHGGAISFDIGATESSIIDSTFINNTAVLYGGAVHFREGASEDKIINSTFEKNHANEDGGALYIDGDDCELHNSTFTSNYAGDDGGAINWRGDVGTIYNITCVNNSGISSHGNSKGGTVCLNGNNITLSNSSFKQSYAKVAGGAIFVTGNYVNITDSEFKDCNVTTETGGAIQIVGNHVEVRDSTFEECHAPNGGAIYAEGQYVKIIDSNFTNNNVTKDGAALYVNGDYSELHNSTFKENIAGDDGGAIYWQGAHGTINNITCENNHGISSGDSNSNGGTICITGKDITLSNSTFKNSSAGAQGGAIFVTGDNVNILTSEFESCNSTGEGGAIYVLGDDTTISESTFENCNATQGGAIYVEGNRATISVNITDTHATGAEAYAIVVDYKLYKDNVKEIKYDINNTIEYVADIKVDGTFTNETLTDLNTTLKNLYGAVDNILTADGINMTNVTKALDIVHQLNATLIQLNASLPEGKDKNITLQLLTDIQNIENELNYLIDISKTLEVPDSITAEIDTLISEVNAITSGGIDDNKTDLISTLNGIRSDVEKILNGNTFNATNIEHALKLLNNLTDTLKELNATLLNGNDKNTVIHLMGEVKDIENQLNGLSDMVVVPEVVSRGGAIYISGNNTLIDNSVINSTDALYGGGLYIAGHDVKVDNSEFINLYSGEDGGAIYITGLRGQLYNSKFINNTAGDDGGAIYWNGNYGKIYNITCESNRGISLNGSSSNGGTIALTGNDTSIEKSRFSQTYALISGGAIFVTGNNVNITDSQFKDCNVSMNISDTHKDYANGGGAIYLFGNSSNVVNCTFDNSEAREGGAIYVQGHTATIDKSNFTDSSALNGGTIYIDGDHAIVKGCMINNTIAGNDSHSLFDENLNVSAFKDGLLGKGGAIYIRSENAQILDSTITSSYTTHEGGAIYVEGNNATISVDFIDCGAGFPVAWVSPDRDLFKPLTNNVLIRVNGLIAFNNNVFNGIINNLSGIPNSMNTIRNDYVNKIFNDKKVLQVNYLQSAITKLTELNNTIHDKVIDSVLLNTLDLSYYIELLSAIPDDGTYDNYYNTNVKPVLDGLNNKKNYVSNVQSKYSDYKNNLNNMKNKLTNLYKQTTLRGFNRVVYDIMVNIANIETDLGVLFSAYAGTDFTEVSNNFTYVKSQMTLIQNAGETLQNMGVQGGAIYVAGNDTNITGSTFLRCLASNALKGEGGAIYITGLNTTITSSEFMNCSAPDNGGSIYVSGKNTRVENSTFNKTSAEIGGAIYILGSETTIDGSSFVDSSADYRGGAIYIEGLNAHVKYSNFTDSAVTGGIFNNTNPRGGAIYIKENNAVVEGSIFNNSAVSTSVGEGGAIYIEGDYAKILGSEFESSSAKTGGAIYLEGDNCNVGDSLFNDSYAADNGGAMYSTGSSSTVYNSNFTYNLAENSGGAVYWYGGSRSKYNTVDGCVFTNNTAHGNTTSADATRGGGAIYWSENGEYGTVKHSKFYYNSVQSTINKKVDGGAILWDKSYHALVDDCSFVGNFVTTDGDTSGTSASDVWAQGGAMYLRPYCNYTVQNCRFENCSSSKEAGALYIQSNNPSPASPSYDGNANKITLKDSVFINNVALANGRYNINGGGAIQIKQANKADFINLTFINNTANKGGALCVFDSVSGLTVTGANFTGNKAVKGSAISASRGFTLNNAVLIENRANTTQFDLDFDRTGGNINILLEGGDTHLNSMYMSAGSTTAFTVTLNNVTYWTNNNISTGKTNVTSSSQSPVTVKSVPEKGISITVELFDANNNKLNVGNDTFATDENGKLHLIPDNFGLTSFNDVYVVARLTNEDYYTQVQKTTRLPSSMVATADNVTYHRNATVHVTITPSTGAPAATGNVSVYYGDVFLGNITVSNNVGVSDEILTNLTADKFLEVGMHNLTLRYWGDLYNDAVNIIAPINVTKAQSNITFAFGEIGYDLMVNLTIVDDWNDKYYADATGNVTVEVYGSLAVPIQTRTVYLVNGTGLVAFDLLPANYTIKATYNGDKNYNASVNSTPAELHKKHDIRILIELNATAGDIMVDETVYINIKILTPEGYNATGNVSLYLDNEKYILPLNATSQASFNKTGLSAGHKIVTVCYDGSEDLQANYGEASFNVLKYNTTFTINVTNITHNQKEIINITFANETEGVVYIFVNDRNYSAPIHNRTAILELSNLTVGEHNVTVKFPGDWTFNNVTNMTRFYVEKVAPEIIINVDNVTYGDPTKIIINVPDCVSGDVSIKIDGTPNGTAKPIVNGKVEFDLGKLNAGEYTVEAIYSGDTNHTGTSKEQKFKVYKANRTVEIDVQNIVHGAVEHITVHVNATGNVTIRVNGKSETITLNNGIAELDVYNLTANTYTVDVTYNGNDNYNKSSASKEFVVAKMTTSLDVQVHDVLVRGMEYINITVKNSTGQVAKDLNGTLTLNIDGVNRAVKIVNGTATFYSSEFNSVVGKRVVWAFFEGNVNFTESKAMNTYQVNTRTLNDNEWNVTAKNIYVGQAGNITVLLPSDVTGFLNIEVKAYPGYGDRDDTYYAKPVNGKAVLNPKDLKEGKYHVYVTYMGTDYEGSYLDTFFTVSKFPTTIEVSVVSPITDGDDAIITVTMTPDINGTVELTVGDKIYYVAVVNGTGRYVVNNLANGTYAIKAIFAGDTQYFGKTSNTAILEVNMIPTGLSISIDKTSMNITDNAVVSIELLDKSGNVIHTNAVVTVKVNGNNHTVGLVNGKGSFTLSGLDNDTYIITAVFAGVDKYMQSISNTLTLDVIRLTPKVNVSATNRSVDETVTITVSIPANATGYVVVSGNFTDNEIYIANSEFTDGVATIDVAGLANGTYSVHITYYGLDNDPYAMSVNDTNFTVSKLNATVRIDVNDTIYDNNVNIIVYVDNGVEGTITIKLNNTDLGTYGIVNGKVNITVDNPGAEKYTVYAIYNGNYKYNVNNTASKDFTVERATPVITIDSVTVDANTSAVIKVHINSTATGKMNITVNRATYTADIIDGVATFNNIPVLPVGEYDITANYYALTDTNYTVGSATLGNGLNVTKVKCYPINISTVDVKAGEETTITVYVPVDATGKVYIEVNGTKLNKTVSGGKAEFKVTKEIEGRYVVNATFVDDKYANKTILGNYYVNYADTVMGIDIAEPVYVNDTAVITVTVPAGITGKVTIEINGKSYTNKTVTAAGIVFEVPKITYGNKTVVAIYSGDSKYIANSTTKNFTVIKHDSKVNVTAIGNAVGSNATISVNVTDTATGYVVVNVNGTNYTINLTGSCGSVQIAGLKAGTYYVHATYIGDDKYKSSINNTQTFTMAKSDVIMNITVASIDYGQKANITVNITSDATGFITISINNTRNVTLPIVDGKVNWIVEGLGVENYTVYANYSGDGKYNINDTSETFNVTKATPTITIESVDVNSARNATVVVHITPETTGFINITVNGENYSGRIDNGVAKIIIKQLNAGNYSVFANYTGDWNFTKASINQTNRVNVYKYSCYAMNVTAADTKVGVNTTITVNVPEDAVGKVVIYVNNTWAGNATISHGVATLELNRTISGKYVVNATFGDAKYANKTVTTNFHVVKWDTPMNITVKDAKVGDTVQIIVSVPQDITGGTVTIEINGKKYTNVTDNKGNATFYVENVTYGNKTVTAIYNGNNKYVFNSTTQNFTVTKRNSYVNVTASASVVGLDAVVNVTIPANATGYVIVNVNGTNYTVNTTNGNGSIVIKNLGNGKYTVNVTYIGDDQYLSSTNGTDFTILRIQPTFSVNGTDITYGAKELIKFESVENITAPIKVEINGRNYTAFIIEGKGNLTVENLAAGKYNVTIYFAGNDKYMNATANNTFTVEKGVMPIYVIAQNITYSEESVFTIYVNATGKVDIYILNATDGDMVTAFGNIDIVNYEYVLPVFLDAGNYTVRVDYKGNANYTGSSAKANFTVFKKDPTITIEVQNITYGGVEHIIVRVNAEGNVTIKVNGTEETIVLREDDNAIVVLRAAHNPLPTYNEKAHEYLYNLNVGEYPVEVTFNGNENYNKATATALFFVNADNTTVNVDVDDIATGGKETINVTLSNKNATGNVTINVDGVNYTRPITNGTANLTLTNLPAGNHSVVVIYEGDNNFRGNWTSAIFSVTKVKPTLTIDVNDTSAGKVAKIIINLPDNATGFVVIDVDGTKYHADIVPGQEIALEVDNLLNKTYHVTAEYSGDEYWDTADNSSSFNVNITKADISVKVENITVGDMAIINITAPKELNGNVTVNVDGKNYTVYVAGGNGILVVPGLDVGNYTVNVTFAGTDRFGPSNTTAKLEVSKVNVTSDDIKVIDQGNGTVVVVVGGNAAGNVTVYVDGKNFTGEIVNGTAVITLENVTPGVNDIEVVYSGDDKHSNSTVNGTVTIPRLDTEFAVTVDEGKEGENTTITVKVPKDTTGNVTVTIDGQKYTAEIDNGTAVITVENLTAGNKTAIIEYTGDANYTSNYTTVNFTVGNAKAVPELVVVDHGNGTVVVVIGDNATGNVTIKVGDNVFNATVVNGTAVVQVGNLTPGVNDVEVIYSGDDTHTNSTVNTTIIGPKYDTPFVVNVTEVTEGETATITVKVPENATGNVTVTFDGQKYSAEIVNGTATIPISNLTAGDKSLIVEYAGDDNYASNYTIGNFTVDEAKVVPDMKVIDQGNGTVVVVVGDNATGNVTIKVGDKEYNATVVNGTAVVQLDGNVTPGTHEVDVIYSGDDTHEATNATVEITAPKYSTEVKVDASEVTEGEPLVVTVEVPDGATGNVTVYIDGKDYPGEIKDGVAVVTIDDLTAGNKTYVVEYSGDGNFSANYTIGNVTVKEAKSTPDMKVIDQGNGTVVVVIGDDATGNVTVKVGDKEFNATVVNGTAVVQLDGNVTPGTHEVEIIYSGDATHEAANSTANITAPKYDSSIDVVIGEAKEGEPFNVTVKVPDGATGDVIVNVGGKNYTGTVKDGEVIVTVDNLTAGNHTIAVVYTGDDNFTGTYSIGNLTVEKAKEVPDMKVIDQGNGTVVVVVGDNASGNVTIKVGDKEYNATVVNGTAVVQLDGNVTPGTHEVDVIYSGDDTHEASNTTVEITAPKYSTEVKVDASEVTEGEPLVVTVEVPDGATGNVTVYIDGKEYPGEIKDGVAVVTIDDLTAGNKTYVVEYSGDGNFSANYTIGNVTVKEAKSTPDMKVIDQGNGTVVVVVGDNASGNVTVKVGDKEFNATVVNGTAVVQLDNVAPGTHEVEVIYSGDDKYSNSTATGKVSAPKLETPIKVEAQNSEVGDKAIIKVTVPENATGNVTIEIDGEKYTSQIKDGVATFEIENLTAGTKTIAVDYAGDENYLDNHTTGKVTVSKCSSFVNATITDIDVGENVTVTVNVPKDATGQVLIDIDGVGYYVNVTDGVGTAQIPRMPNGVYNVGLTYTGDDKYASSSNTASFNVSKVESFVIPKAEDIYVGDNEILTFIVPVDATGTVTVIVNGTEYNFDLEEGTLSVPVDDHEVFTVAISKGSGKLTVSGLPKGEYVVTAHYNGDEKYLPSTNTTTFLVSKSSTDLDVEDFKNGTVVVKVPKDATGNVTIVVEGETYVAEVNNGTAVFYLENATPGVHNIKVTYSGDDKYGSKTDDTTVEIPKYPTPISVSVEDINVGDTAHIVVSVPEDAEGVVTIEIDGQKYQADVVGGKATFDIPDLSAGNKTVAVKYEDGDYYQWNSTTASFEVSKCDAPINVASKNINVGKDETITVTLPKDATGRVLVKINGIGYYADVINGKAKIIIPGLDVGNYDVTVMYEGDDKYLPSSVSTSFKVTKKSTPISSNNDYIEVGEDATIRINLPSDATGTVTITVDGKKYTAEVVDGTAVFKIPGLDVGFFTVTVYYSGDGKYAANETTTVIVVNGTSEGNGSSDDGGVLLSSYPTGNPILILLLIILAIGSTQLRKFKK